MKKRITLLFIALLLAFSYSCKDDDEAAFIYYMNIIQGADVDLQPAETNDHEVPFAVTLNGGAASAVNFTIEVVTETDDEDVNLAVEGTDFTISTNITSIAQGDTAVSGVITVLSSAFAKGDIKTISFELVSSDVMIGINSTMSFNVEKIAYIVLLDEGFEGEEMPEDWITVDVDKTVDQCNGINGGTWELTTEDSFEGDQSIGNCSYTDIFYSDNWLISPAIELSSTGRVEFVVRSSNPNWDNNCHVYISSTTTDVSSFNTQIHIGSGITNSWTEIVATIPPEFDGETIYIGFRDNSDADKLYLDDIVVKAD